MGKQSSIAAKITSSYVAVIALLAVVVMFTLHRGSELNHLSDVVIDNFVPSVKLSLQTSTDIERSMSSLRGWVATGEFKYIEHRRNAWRDINVSLNQLEEHARELGKLYILQDLKTLQKELQQLKSLQDEVETLAHSPANTPGLTLLIKDAVPQAKQVLEGVTQLIHMDYGRYNSDERTRLITHLADFRYSFSQGLAAIRAYLATNKSDFRDEFRRWWQSNTESLARITVMSDRFQPNQLAILNKTIQERDAFSKYPDVMFRYRESPEWNLAKMRTESEIKALAVKVSEEIELIVKKFNERMTDGFSSMRQGVDILIGVGLSLLAVAIVSCGLIMAFLNRLISKPLNKVITAANEIAKGDFDVSVDIGGSKETEQLSDALKEMTDFLKRIRSHAEALSFGQFDHVFQVQGDKDRLGHVLQKMTLDLRERQTLSDQQHWYKSGVAEFANVLQGENELALLMEKAMAFIARYLDVQLAAVYLKTDDRYQLMTGYAYDHKQSLSLAYASGEGLVGQVAAEQQRRVILPSANCADDLLVLDTGIGQIRAACLVAAPVINRQSIPNETLAVLVLGFARELNQIEYELLDEVCDSLSVSVASCLSRNQMAELLEEARQNAQVLEQQQEELRVTNEELEQQTHSLIASEEELKAQSEALKETNQRLELQKAKLESKNQDIENARAALERKAQELAQISRYKSEFLANMSHELRTPLNSLLILSDAMRKNSRGNLFDDQKEDLLVINQAGRVLLSLINDILDLSKVEAGKLKVSFESIRVTSLLEELRKQFQPIATDKQLGFNVILADDLPAEFCTDEQRLAQILRNLLSNAFKFTEKGDVCLTVNAFDKDEQSYLQCSVQDTGIGIPEEFHQEIFGAFQQVDGSTRRAFGGSGLGLTISKELAIMLGGDIDVESTQGEGSCFTLTLPDYQGMPDSLEGTADYLRIDESENQLSADTFNVSLFANTDSNTFPDTDLSVGPNDVSSQDSVCAPFMEDDRDIIQHALKSLLIVEDDYQFAKVLRDFSRKRDFACVVANRGKDAIELAKRYQPKAIILDIGLPDISGVDVLEQLKVFDATKDIPVHIISGQESYQDLMREGAMGVLNKPISYDTLEQLFYRFSTLAQQQIQTLLFIGKRESTCEELKEIIHGADIQLDTMIVPDGNFTLSELNDRLQNSNVDCCLIELDADEIEQQDWLLALSDASQDILFPPSIIYTDKPLNDHQYRLLSAITDRIVIKGDYAPERISDEVECFLYSINESLPSQSMNELIQEGDINLSGRKVLLVDDDLRNTYALSRVLKEYGMQIYIADNGALAVEKFKENQEFDLVLMDIMMPVMDGYDAIRCIRTDHSSDVPIIALTAKAMAEDRERCLEVGASDYLPKPIEMDRLISLIKVWVN